VLVTAIEARPLRSLDHVRVDLEPGIVSVIGPNGVGKTNLIEALYFALTGRSFRTSDRRDLIPFGGSLARAEATVRDEDGIEHTLLAAVSRSEGRRHLLDGNPSDPATIARSRPPVAVFAPDRLTLVKGPPAERRAHLDGFVAARWPVRGELRKRFGQAVAQRNALLSRLGAGYGSPLVSYAGCTNEVALDTCRGDNRNISEGTIGYWYRLYGGEFGSIKYGNQVVYVRRGLWSGIGNTPEGSDVVVYSTLRFYLP